MSVSAIALTPTRWRRARSVAPGLLLCLAVAIAAMALATNRWFDAHGFSALTLAIVCGMLVGNSIYSRVGLACGPGVALSKQTLLRAGVVLYGLRLTLQDIAHVGIAGVLIDALMIGSTFALALVLGTRVFKIDRETSMLIGAGSAICGAAAVMATEPVVRARAEQVTVAVATVVVFGTVAIFVYPVLFDLNASLHVLPGGEKAFGVYAGSSIHEVAQVVAATRALGTDVAATAVIAKMVRVMMLAPFLLLLSSTRMLSRAGTQAGPRFSAWASIPWFAIGFVVVVLFNSLHGLPLAFVNTALTVDTVLLAVAMAALGLSTRLAAVREGGVRPLLLAALLAVWLVGGGALVNHMVQSALS